MAAVGCRVSEWREDPYFGRLARVEFDEPPAELVGGLPAPPPPREAWLPPGLYGDCLVEPPGPFLHTPAPFMAHNHGDVVEVKVFARDAPDGGELLADLGGLGIYRLVVPRGRYRVSCCGASAEYRPPPPPPAVPAPLAMYEVLPDRAARRVPCRDLRRDLCGGTLKDVAAAAEEARAFADGLYLHPIYPAMSYHRYDVVDHMEVDERLGGWPAFLALRSRLSALDMALVLDVVLYHVGLRSGLFPDGPFLVRDPAAARMAKALADLLPAREARRLLPANPPYETFLKAVFMPRLDYGRPEAAEYAGAVLARWRPHVDGFRFDVAHGIPPEAWRRILPAAEGRYLLGEHTGNPVLLYPLMHGFTAYLLYGAVREFFGGGSAEALERGIRLYLALTPPGALRHMNTFVENHDTDRIAEVAGGDLAAAAAAHALIYLMPGIPSVYMGGECGARGRAEDHTNREPAACGRVLAPLLRGLYRLRASAGLAWGPLWVRARRGRLLLRAGAVEAEVSRRRAVAGDLLDTDIYV